MGDNLIDKQSQAPNGFDDSDYKPDELAEFGEDKREDEPTPCDLWQEKSQPW